MTSLQEYLKYKKAISAFSSAVYALFQKCSTDENGVRQWRNKNGALHHLYGPACIAANGMKYWYTNGHLRKIQFPDGQMESFPDAVFTPEDVSEIKGASDVATRLISYLEQGVHAGVSILSAIFRLGLTIE